MDEKRKEKRIPITIALSVSDLYPDDVYGSIDMSSPIEVTDISSKGIGFLSDAVLPVGFVFIADIELDRSLPQIITDIRIIRSSTAGPGMYRYGCEFVSISPRVSKMLGDYEARSAGGGFSTND
ncbi:MAG: PilZ domain-containing protein [Lachnospiraceae bacterium]|nr:PilZ domain-containing protein [Lachnospiraceae bacterium]